MPIEDFVDERRQKERRPVDREVIVEIDGTRVPGRLVEYSEDGAFIRLGVDVSPNAGATIRFALEGRSEEPMANVQRVAPEGVGLRFGSDRVARIIDTWVQPHMARAATFAGDSGRRK